MNIILIIYFYTDLHDTDFFKGDKEENNSVMLNVKAKNTLTIPWYRDYNPMQLYFKSCDYVRLLQGSSGEYYGICLKKT